MKIVHFYVPLEVKIFGLKPQLFAISKVVVHPRPDGGYDLVIGKRGVADRVICYDTFEGVQKYLDKNDLVEE